MTAREPGQHRRDLRHHLKPGAGRTSHRRKSGCGKAAATVVLLGLALPVAVFQAGWTLADILWGGA